MKLREIGELVVGIGYLTFLIVKIIGYAVLVGFLVFVLVAFLYYFIAGIFRGAL